jgi:hypothetical protein
MSRSPLPPPFAHFIASEAYRVLSDSVRAMRPKPKKKKETNAVVA